MQKGGSSIPYPIKYFEKYPISLKENGNYPQIQKALYPHFPRIDPNILYPFKYLQIYPVSLFAFGPYPCIPKKTFQASLSAAFLFQKSH